LDSLTADKFCSAAHLCSSSSSVILVSAKDGEECATCVQRLQPRKDAATQVIDRLSAYFTDLCKKTETVQCQEFVSEVMTEARSFINDFHVQDTCKAMGFCGPNATYDVDNYEHAFVEEIGKEVCSMLGPFDELCQQVVQGNSKQVQTVSLNATSIHEFFTRCEKETPEENATAGKCCFT
jgi:hypothetical protein